MKEDNRKRINKLIVPFTKRTLSFLTASTMLVTGTVGCKENEKNEKDTSSIISSVSDEDITSSDNLYVVDDNNTNINNESSKIEQTNNEISNNITSSNNTSSLDNNESKNNNSTNNNSSNKNNQSSNTNNNPNSLSNTSRPSSNTTTIPSTPPSEPTMPSTLTAQNINNVEVFKKFANLIAADTRGNFGGIWTYYYSGETYKTFGIPEPEFRYVLAGLNYNYVNSDTLKAVFGNYSLDDIKRFNCIIELLVVSMDQTKTVNNWNNLIVDKSNLNYMKQIDSAYLNYINGVDKNKLRNLLDGGMKSNNPIIRKYFSYVCRKAFVNDNYDNHKYNSLAADLIFATNDEIEAFSIDFYNKVKSKTKVLN